MFSDKFVILCVDDEESPLRLRKLVLEKNGYDVMTASSAKEALTIFGSHHLDLVLSDYMMPAMNGVALARQIKSADPNLPIILLSGVNEVPEGADIADAFLTKVGGVDALCGEIQCQLTKQRLGERPKTRPGQ